MRPPDRHEALSAEELELLARYDGTERIPDLPTARFVTVAPVKAIDEPVDVTIEWPSGEVQKPLPGSALWRAVLLRHLEGPVTDPSVRVVRSQIWRSLSRFPDLETWWHWLRTGWTAPPNPESGRARVGVKRWWRR